MSPLSREDLAAKIDGIMARLTSVFRPIAVYLFGSYAYGSPDAGSDIDLLVIVEESTLHPHARDAVAYKAVGAIGVSKDIQVYTRKEFEDRAALPSSFERTVREKGRLVYAAADA